MSRPHLRLVPPAADPEPDLGYEPASPEQSLAIARWMLLRLDGFELAGLEETTEPDRCDVATRRAYAVCDDCRHETHVRFRLGTVTVCRLCATARRHAARKAAA